MRFWKRLKKKSKPLDAFQSIHDCPVKVWFDIHKTSDCLLLLKHPQEVDANGMNELWKIWDRIYNEYIEEFGLSDEFLTDLNDKIRLANYKAEFVITGDRYLKTMIKIEEEKMRVANKENKMNESPNLESLLAKMSKFYGFKLNSRELTIAEYYSYLKNIGNG